MRSSWSRILLGGAFILCLAVAGGRVARAGQHPDPGSARAVKKWLTQLTKSLKLSTEQQQQIAPILQETEYLTAEIRRDESLSPEEKFVRNNIIIDRSNKKIESVLEEKQKRKFLRLEAKMRDWVEGERGIPPDNPGPPPDGGPPPGGGPFPDGGPPPG